MTITNTKSLTQNEIDMFLKNIAIELDTCIHQAEDGQFILFAGSEKNTRITVQRVFRYNMKEKIINEHQKIVSLIQKALDNRLEDKCLIKRKNGLLQSVHDIIAYSVQQRMLDRNEERIFEDRTLCLRQCNTLSQIKKLPPEIRNFAGVLSQYGYSIHQMIQEVFFHSQLTQQSQLEYLKSLKYQLTILNNRFKDLSIEHNIQEVENAGRQNVHLIEYLVQCNRRTSAIELTKLSTVLYLTASSPIWKFPKEAFQNLKTLIFLNDNRKWAYGLSDFRLGSGFEGGCKNIEVISLLDQAEKLEQLELRFCKNLKHAHLKLNSFATIIDKTKRNGLKRLVLEGAPTAQLTIDASDLAFFIKKNAETLESLTLKNMDTYVDTYVLDSPLPNLKHLTLSGDLSEENSETFFTLIPAEKIQSFFLEGKEIKGKNFQNKNFPNLTKLSIGGPLDSSYFKNFEARNAQEVSVKLTSDQDKLEFTKELLKSFNTEKAPKFEIQ